MSYPGSTSADDRPDGPGPADEFWEAGSLNRQRIREFVQRLETHRVADPVVDPLATSTTPLSLHQPRDRLQRRFAARRSERKFADRPVSERELGAVMAALAGTADGRRTYPSAGGLGSVEVYALLDRVDGRWGRVAARYLPDAHALAPLHTELPPADQLDELCTLEGSNPPLVLVFAIRMTAVREKYGERGLRLALVEVGHACQNVALRLADLGFAGYQLGGLLDAELEEMLGLRNTRVRVVLGYAIGHPGSR